MGLSLTESALAISNRTQFPRSFIQGKEVAHWPKNTVPHG